MEVITHRELRNRSGEALRRVEGGESFLISNNGRLAARLVPVAEDPVDAAIARGEARGARAGLETLRSVTRTTSSITSADLVTNARGRW